MAAFFIGGGGVRDGGGGLGPHFFYFSFFFIFFYPAPQYTHTLPLNAHEILEAALCLQTTTLCLFVPPLCVFALTCFHILTRPQEVAPSRTPVVRQVVRKRDLNPVYGSVVSSWLGRRGWKCFSVHVAICLENVNTESDTFLVISFPPRHMPELK